MRSLTIVLAVYVATLVIGGTAYARKYHHSYRYKHHHRVVEPDDSAKPAKPVALVTLLDAKQDPVMWLEADISRNMYASFVWTACGGDQTRRY